VWLGVEDKVSGDYGTLTGRLSAAGLSVGASAGSDGLGVTAGVQGPTAEACGETCGVVAFTDTLACVKVCGAVGPQASVSAKIGPDGASAGAGIALVKVSGGVSFRPLAVPKQTVDPPEPPRPWTPSVVVFVPRLPHSGP
jgi:hypothetical protein